MSKDQDEKKGESEAAAKKFGFDKCLLKPTAETFRAINADHPLLALTAEARRAQIVSPFSRAHNVDIGNATGIKVIEGIGVNAHTLYQLKTGPNAGKFMGANKFNFAEQSHKGARQCYCASEAPYNRDDYFRMALDLNARTLVSLTQTSEESDPIYYWRNGRDCIRVNIHHLGDNEAIAFDNLNIKCIGEYDHKPKFGGRKLVIKQYQVVEAGKEPYIMRHIIFKSWKDGGSPDSQKNMLELLDAIDDCQRSLAANEDNHIVVNCCMGWGRTNNLILMHQLVKIVNQMADAELAKVSSSSDLTKLTILRQLQKLEVDTDSMVHAVQHRVMMRAAACASLDMLKELPELIIEERGKALFKAKSEEAALSL